MNRPHILLIISLFAFNLNAQTKVKLESNQRELAKEITTTQKQLTKLKQDELNSLEKVEILRHQITTRDELIDNLALQIEFQNADIVAQEADIHLLKDQFDRVKISYQGFIRNFYRTRFQYNALTFIFSAKSILNAWKRMIFYRNLVHYNRVSLAEIEKKETQLLLELQELELNHQAKTNALQELESQKEALNQNQIQNEKALQQIKQNEQFMVQRLNAQKAQKRKLDQQLAALVEASMKSKSEFSKLPASVRKLNNAFGANKGKLPWPVAHGYVSRKFGKQRHPELKMIFINNNGVDIVTDDNEPVMAVFEGNVIAIQSIAGYQKTILINHGTYYSVYANVEDVIVSKGERVQRGQKLAYAASSAEKVTNIHFEIWQGKQLLNPSAWLQAK